MLINALYFKCIASGIQKSLEVKARIRVDQLKASSVETDDVKLSPNINGMYTASEQNCVLLADSGAGVVLRVSLTKECIEEYIIRRVDNMSGVLLLPGDGERIAILISKPTNVRTNIGEHLSNLFRRRRLEWQHSVRLLTRKSNTWQYTYDIFFDDTDNICNYNGLCISRGILLCAAFQYSRRLVAFEVTSDSKLCLVGTLKFDSETNGLCAFPSKGEHLLATTHKDRTVRVWRHLETSPYKGVFALQECCRIIADRAVHNIIYANEGLFVSSLDPASVMLCKLNGSLINAIFPQQQLNKARILCWCSVQDNIVAYDREGKWLITFPKVDSKENPKHTENLSALISNSKSNDEEVFIDADDKLFDN